MIEWIEKNRYAAIILTILIAVEIFYFSSIPGGQPGTGGGITVIPIIYHFSVFFLFSFFLLISILGNKRIKISYIIIALSIAIIYAVLDEIHQIFVPFREPTIQDILTNTVGIFSSMILYLYFKRNN